MLFKTISASVYGIDAYLVEVEVDLGSARMQDFNVVGLPDNAVKESRERIKSALRNCGFEFPYGQGVTINLAPADVRKEGSGFDLPMALGLAGCMGQFFGKPLDQCMFLGELSLDGGVRPVRGALSAALAARDKGLKAIAVPEANAREAAVVEGVNVFALKSLPQAVDLVNSPESFTPVKVDAGQMLSQAAQYNVDLRDVRGQQAAKRALEVSCAGGHNILFIGPPGAGKTMLAKRIPTILRPMSLEEAIETTRIHSVAGTLDDHRGLIQRYVSKISGPLLDRIDIHIEVPAVKYKELRTPALAEDSETVRSRVVAARNRQLERYRGEQKTYSNAQMLPKMLRKHCGITPDGEKLLENAITRLGLSARAHDRILKVARTIADLEATENIAPKHLSEAIQYRTLDRSYWA
jgi:predicted ATPase with chaperone activity